MARSATSAGEEEGIAKVETSKVAKKVVVMGEFSGPAAGVNFKLKFRRPPRRAAQPEADFMASSSDGISES